MAGSTRSSAWRQLGRLFEGGTVAGLDDGELLGRFVDRRDELAFAALVERHGPMVLGVCRAVLKDAAEVEDAFQATFLVLVRRAGSIREGDTLGGWLHRVAYRIAVRAAADIAQRRHLEQRAGGLAAMKTDLADFPDDLRALLHEEIDRLPEKFRLAIVLCDLDGLSRPDAARQLGWTEGALRGRLARARSKLRDRLTNRGLIVTAALLAEALARESSAAVPRLWVDVLVKAAATLPAGKIVATGGISATVVKLAQAALAGLVAESARGAATVGVLLVALGMVGLHAVPIGRAQSGDGEAMKREMPGPKPAATPSPKPLAPRAEEDRTKPVTFAGMVLDPDGKPFAGAKIYVMSYGLYKGLVNPPVRAASGADGRFRFDVPIDEFDRTFDAAPWGHSPVVARAEGFAFGLANLTKEGKELTLRLARDDVPIEGRIIDIQGRPVQGASIQVRSINATDDENLTDWSGAVYAKKAMYVAGVSDILTRQLEPQPDPPLASSTRTDADGRFRITGIGRERLAELHIAGPTIEAVRVMARTRPGEALQVPAYGSDSVSNRSIRFGSSFTTSQRVTIYGSSFVHVAGPTRPIEGIIRDQETGTPLAGITVIPHTSNPLESTWARTDARGHYRLVGLPRGREGDIVAVSPADLPAYGRKKAEMGYPPEESLPYLQSRITVPKEDIKNTVSLDIGLRRGVLVTGRVLDKATGKPVAAQLRYYVFRDNPILKLSTGNRMSDWFQVHFTPRDGTYRLIAFPGPGLLTAKADRTDGHDDRYTYGAGLEQSKRVDQRGHLLCHPAVVLPSNFHTLNEIDPAADAPRLSKDILLDPGRNLPLDVLGPDGKPLAGATVSGLSSRGRGFQDPPLDGTRCTVMGLLDGKPRTITALHKGKKLVGDVAIKGDEAGPLSVRLEPWGEVVGRMVDAVGRPRAESAFLIDDGNKLESAPVGPDGRFHVKGLIPGRNYSYLFLDEPKSTITGYAFRDVSVKPGEIKDVGDVTPKVEGPN